LHDCSQNGGRDFFFSANRTEENGHVQVSKPRREILRAFWQAHLREENRAALTSLETPALSWPDPERIERAPMVSTWAIVFCARRGLPSSTGSVTTKTA
jgi:hypothetical protein